MDEVTTFVVVSSVLLVIMIYVYWRVICYYDKKG